MNTLNGQMSSAEYLLNKIIAERRATPNFDGSPVSNEALSTIIKAGMESPYFNASLAYFVAFSRSPISL